VDAEVKVRYRRLAKLVRLQIELSDQFDQLGHAQPFGQIFRNLDPSVLSGVM